MKLLKSKKTVITASVLGVMLIVWLFGFYDSTEDSSIYVPVKSGVFEINVFTTGELEAKNSVSILGPSGIRSIGIWQVKISDLVAEGTVVAKGDYIAALDKTEIMNKIKDEESELSKIESKYIQTKLDTTLDLRQARDELVNQAYGLKEKQIVVEQSTYEPPATIRQSNIDLEKATRTLEQTQQNYKLKENQAIAKMQEITASLNQAQNKLEIMKNLLIEFTIIAPEDGMLIYQREWNGKKKVVGSTIGAWEPTVATLPDLSVMLSKTYVNEVDIRKVKKGQFVNIILDAYPEKKLTGKVVTVANVGEQNPKSDAKVFEVNIQINEKDTTLRPAMTTGNNIRAERLDSVLFIPLETIHSMGDSLIYVFKKEGLSLVKREVKIGQTNDNFAVVLKGLKKEDVISLSPPSDPENIELVRLKEELN